MDCFKSKDLIKADQQSIQKYLAEDLVKLLVFILTELFLTVRCTYLRHFIILAPGFF